MKTAFLLVHGYLGTVADVAPLAVALSRRFPEASVESVALAPHFDGELFVRQLHGRVDAARRNHAPVVLLGHSSGGSIVLSTLARLSHFSPGERCSGPVAAALLATPFRIDGSRLAPFEANAGTVVPALPDVARLVTFVNRLPDLVRDVTGHVLLVQGDADPLVPSADLPSWLETLTQAHPRVVLVPGADHALLTCPHGPLAVDAVCRWAQDVVYSACEGESRVTLEALAGLEPGLGRFLRGSPLSARHVAGSPSGRLGTGQAPGRASVAVTDPVQANFEITTRCNLACPSCARTVHRRPPQDMSVREFKTALGLLPHAWRVLFAGLGEPLLHPQVDRLVAAASRHGRSVGVVTNGTLLDRTAVTALLAAGVSGITVSLDSVDPQVLPLLRPGADLAVILDNLDGLRAEVHRLPADRRPGISVFTAVSTASAGGLPALARELRRLQPDGWMVSDLNFLFNRRASLAGASSSGTFTAASGSDDSLPPSSADSSRGSGPCRAVVREAVREALRSGFPALSVGGLEQWGLARRWREFLLSPPARLWQRSQSVQTCWSPWQTVPVAVNGDVTLCDCRPDAVAGNLFSRPFSEIWNGDEMVAQRAAMVARPPPECRDCPRF